MPNKGIGFYNKYTIIRNSNGEEVNGFVLDPLKDQVARDAIQFYIDHTQNSELREDLQEWLAQFSDENCCILSRICPNTQTPICCCQCPRRGLCEYDDNLCDRVRYDGLEDISQCKQTIEED